MPDHMSHDAAATLTTTNGTSSYRTPASSKVHRTRSTSVKIGSSPPSPVPSLVFDGSTSKKVAFTFTPNTPPESVQERLPVEQSPSLGKGKSRGRVNIVSNEDQSPLVQTTLYENDLFGSPRLLDFTRSSDWTNKVAEVPSTISPASTSAILTLPPQPEVIVGNTSVELLPLQPSQIAITVDDGEGTILPVDDKAVGLSELPLVVTVQEILITSTSILETPTESPHPAELEEHIHEEIVVDANNVPQPPPARTLIMVPYGNEEETNTINQQIYKYILDKWDKNDTYEHRKGELGFVYMIQAEEFGPRYIKIGQTKANVTLNTRHNNIGNACNLTLTQLPDERNAYPHFGYVEKIVHAALHNYRRTYDCDHCPSGSPTKKFTTHKEYFEVEYGIALHQIKLWRGWIVKQKPFNYDGTLTEYWHWRLEQVPKNYSTIRWEKWTQPTGIMGDLDYFYFALDRWQRGKWTQVKSEMKSYVVREEIWQKSCWLWVTSHMGRKDRWFLQTGLSIVLGVGWGVGIREMWAVVFALLLL